MTRIRESTATQPRPAPFPSKSAPGYHTFLPLQERPIGSLLPSDQFPQNENPPPLFEPLTIRGVEFPNRLMVAPMCMYSSDNGHATDFHFVHDGSMANRGWGSVMVEATAVVPEGRITPEDAGLWQDSQIAPLKRIVDYVHASRGIIGIQLAHAGRKASTLSPWVRRQAEEAGWTGSHIPDDNAGGWANNVVGPSAISFDEENYPSPVEASGEYIENLKKAWISATERCKAIGFDFVEIHGAHGYLFHEFVDPISNKRTDQYGGSLENRLRLPLEVSKAIRAIWDKPLFYRVSATDWLDGELGPEKNAKTGEYAWWGLEQSTILATKLRDIGIDLYDVSTGGNSLKQDLISVGPGYQVPFAEHIKKTVPKLLIGAVGLITEPKQANDILVKGQADVILMAREVLRDIDFPLKAALELGVAVQPMVQYERAWSRMVVPKTAGTDEGVKKGKEEVEGEEGREKDNGEDRD